MGMRARVRGCVRWRMLLLYMAAMLLLCAAIAQGLLLPQYAQDGFIKKNGTVVDASQADQGYVHVKHKESKKRLKLRISKGNDTYTYDLNQDGEFETFPLQLGSGKYKISVYQQVKGSQYSSVSSLSVSAKLEDEMLPFLYPSQYCWYDADSPVVAQSEALCAQIDGVQGKVDAVEAYVTGRFMYDYMKAFNIGSVTTYLPDVNDVFEKKTGICFDLAAVVCCMLRAQGIPTQLVIGYADAAYHAWNRVYVEGRWQLIDTTSKITGVRVRQYTTERYY